MNSGIIINMIQNKTFLIGYKVFFALLGFSAVVTEIATIVERGTFNFVNFFSYFTIETNLLVVVTLLLSAFAVAAGKRHRFDILRTAVTVYILVVGIGFSFLLSGLEDVALTAVPWDNTVLHYIIPVAVFVDFLIDRPRRTLSFKKSLMWLLFPIGYAVYSLVRGALVGWYPYPFLNPSLKGAWSVAFVVVALLVLGVALVWLVGKLTTRKTTKS